MKFSECNIILKANSTTKLFLINFDLNDSKLFYICENKLGLKELTVVLQVIYIAN